MPTTVLLCGVGGQGTILAAHILAEVAHVSGMRVKVSEIHGMSQRGGAVTTVVVFGEEVASMVSGRGCADVIVSFEAIEALRNLDQLRRGGVLVVNDEVIKPASVLTGAFSLDADIAGELARAGALLVPAEDTARVAGNAKASNVVLLGALSRGLPFACEAWEEVIARFVPPKTVEVNLAAFRAGRAFAEEHAGEGGRAMQAKGQED